MFITNGCGNISLEIYIGNTFVPLIDFITLDFREETENEEREKSRKIHWIKINSCIKLQGVGIVAHRQEIYIDDYEKWLRALQVHTKRFH